MLVEALPANYYRQAHLPDALNIPHDAVDALAPRLLPDKNAEIVVYCASATCRNSDYAARRLSALGYGNVRTYAGGKADWIDAGLPVESGDAHLRRRLNPNSTSTGEIMKWNSETTISPPLCCGLRSARCMSRTRCGRSSRSSAGHGRLLRLARISGLDRLSGGRRGTDRRRTVDRWRAGARRSRFC